MAVVAGRNRVNRPYFFTDTGGERVEFPSFGFGQGDLEGNELRMFNMYVSAEQIEAVGAEAPEAFTSTMWSVAGGSGKITVTLTALPDGNGFDLDGVSVTVPGEGDFIIPATLGAHEITDISAGTYSITLTAVTPAGESAASPAKSVTVS